MAEISHITTLEAYDGRRRDTHACEYIAEDAADHWVNGAGSIAYRA